MAKKTRIYIDTSIVGGFFDKEFAAETRMLFEKLKNSNTVFVISDVLKNELPENFSCLEMKRQIQAKIYAEIKDMTTEERIAYFHIPPEKDPFRVRSGLMR